MFFFFYSKILHEKNIHVPPPVRPQPQQLPSDNLITDDEKNILLEMDILKHAHNIGFDLDHIWKAFLKQMCTKRYPFYGHYDSIPAIIRAMINDNDNAEINHRRSSLSSLLNTGCTIEFTVNMPSEQSDNSEQRQRMEGVTVAMSELRTGVTSDDDTCEFLFSSSCFLYKSL